MSDELPDNAVGTMLSILLDMSVKEFNVNSPITAYRDFVLKHKKLLKVTEPVKSNAKAAQLRQEGNRLFQTGRFLKALAKYNESLCYVEAGSEQLAMGYGNRSAIYFKKGEYEFSLLNIGLAKAQNCPEKLLEKLEERAQKCREKLDEGLAKDNVPCPRMGINVEVNPKIPFVAKGVGMKQYPGSGRGLVAERNFKAGDVILEEKAIINVVSWPFKYYICSRCGISNEHSLIPCPGCVSYMYCSEECCAEDRRLSHRFECGLAARNENISFNYSNTLPKWFFYGLTLFNDDLSKMMNYCEKNAGIGSNPFTLDYIRYDPLEEFKVFHKAKLPCSSTIEVPFRLCAAANYVVLMEHPPVQALVKTDSQKRFFLNCLYQYQRVTSYFSWESNSLAKPPVPVVSGIMSIGALINHSCDQNAMIRYDAGRIKCVLIRPVRKGEQITTSLGPAWTNAKRQQGTDLSFKCKCNVCTYGHVLDWVKTGKPLPVNAYEDLTLCIAMVGNTHANEAAKLNAFQQFFQRYAQYLPNPAMSLHVRFYISLLENAIEEENVRLNRARMVAAVI